MGLFRILKKKLNNFLDPWPEPIAYTELSQLYILVESFTYEEITEEQEFIDRLVQAGLADTLEAIKTIVILDEVKKKAARREWREKANQSEVNRKAGATAQGKGSFTFYPPGKNL